MIISLDAEKVLTRFNTPGEIRNTRDILKHNKGYLQKAHSQHPIKWRENQNNSTKIRNKAKLLILPIPIHYRALSLSKSNKKTKGDQGDRN